MYSTGSDVMYSTGSDFTPELYRILIHGRTGVGKTALLHQFMTSEYLGNADHIPGKFYKGLLAGRLAVVPKLRIFLSLLLFSDGEIYSGAELTSVVTCIAISSRS